MQLQLKLSKRTLSSLVFLSLLSGHLYAYDAQINQVKDENTSTCPYQNEGEQAALSDRLETDIVDTAVAAGTFNTLAAALKAANLIEALKGDGPFTVFAPNDQAFEHSSGAFPLIYGRVKRGSFFVNEIDFFIFFSSLGLR